MPSKKLEINDSLQDIEREYKLMKDHYHESVKKLSRDFDILKHSKANTNYDAQNSWLEHEGEKDEILEISQAIINLAADYAKLEELMFPIIIEVRAANSKDGELLYGHTELVEPSVLIINQTTDKLNDLEEKTNKLRQDLPIVQSIQIFIREASERFGKFCTAVMSLFIKIEPEKEANKARASMVTHFDKLRESVNKHKDDIETGEFRHKPDARRESGFDMV